MHEADRAVAGSVAEEAAELAARASYGRLLAHLVARTRDIEVAEDALSDAFVAALEQWPRDGVPESPDAWLMQVARRRLSDDARHRRVRAAKEPLIVVQEELDRGARAEEVADERLALCFLCAHPDVEESARAPLMLQLVLGVDAARIAAAFLTSPSSMSQRLVRAKARARELGLSLSPPRDDEYLTRLPAVLDAIYAAYGTGLDASAGAEPSIGGLRREAVWLARLIVQAVPAAAEARGLLALLLYSEARASARRGRDGRYVPLPEQDPAQWDAALIGEAEEQLAEAARLPRTGLPGRYALEAAIQSVHVRRRETGNTDWLTVVQLYMGLLQVAPSVGAAVAHASALGEAYGARAGLDALAAVPEALAATYQPYWAVKAHLERREGLPDANRSLEKAIGLSSDAAVRAFLQDSLAPS